MQKNCGNVCESAKFHTSANVRNVCNIRVGVATGVFLEKIVEMCSKVWMCEISHTCEMCATCLVWLPENFWQKNCGNVCESADVRNFARPHMCEMCATCVQVWLLEFFFFGKIFFEKCVKVRMCEISHVRTPARVRNVFNV